ncbi:RrF2 family transcriptional regulator [Candidatus Omnitrophota bacterium]
MKLTTKSSYGIRALINLAIMHDNARPVTIKDISREEGISYVYLEQIFNRLKKQGIVNSIRGPKGGYVLSRDPSEVNVYEIISALEGVVYPGRCKAGRQDTAGCELATRCASKEVWDEVARQLRTVLEGFSLEDLASRALSKSPCKGVKAQLYEKGLS